MRHGGLQTDLYVKFYHKPNGRLKLVFSAIISNEELTDPDHTRYLLSVVELDGGSDVSLFVVEAMVVDKINFASISL